MSNTEVQEKTAQDIHNALDRREERYFMDRAGLTEEDREQVAHGISKLRQAADMGTTVSVEVVAQQLVRKLSRPALDYLEGPLTTAKWFVYDRTGRELPMRRLR